MYYYFNICLVITALSTTFKLGRMLGHRIFVWDRQVHCSPLQPRGKCAQTGRWHTAINGNGSQVRQKAVRRWNAAFGSVEIHVDINDGIRRVNRGFGDAGHHLFALQFPASLVAVEVEDGCRHFLLILATSQSPTPSRRSVHTVYKTTYYYEYSLGHIHTTSTKSWQFSPSP